MRYSVYIADAFGNFLAPLSQSGFVGDPNAASSIKWSRSTNDIGVAVVTIAGTLAPELVTIDNQLYIYRKPLNGSPKLLTGTSWIIRRYRLLLDDNGQQYTEITALSGSYLLTSRGIAYYADTAQTNKTAAADNMMKEIVRENLGSSATDTTRSLSPTIFSVQADSSRGPTIERRFAWRSNMLTVLQELADASRIAGTYIAFDLIRDSQTTWQFQTFAGQRGTDRRIGSSLPLMLGPEYGNLTRVEYMVDWVDHANSIYSLGQGEGAGRIFGTAVDTVRAGASPVARREAMVEARNTDDAGALTAAAQAALRDRRPRTTWRGRIVTTPNTQYDVDWAWGDFVTVQAFGQTIDARIDAISVTMENGVEDIDAWIRSD